MTELGPLRARKMMVRLAEVKERQAELAGQKARLESELITEMLAAGVASVSTSIGPGQVVKGTVVRAQGVTYDAVGLQQALTSGQWRKVTSQVLDKARLEAAVTVGDVPLALVAENSELKDIKPYIRVSVSKESG